MSTSVPDSPATLVPVVVDFEGQRWSMFKAGSEPLCKDTDLAAWLEYARPRKIRELIARWADQLGPVERPTMGRDDTDEPYYLTEEQALFIIAKSETSRATWMLKAMIQVFVKARGLVAVAQPVDSFGRLEEWNRMQRHIAIAGETLNHLKDDNASLKTEQADIKKKLDAQLEYIDLLDAKVNRGLTAKQREELVVAIWGACECRVSERERMMLEHVAKHGPATSLARIRAAARICALASSKIIADLVERNLLEFEQRDPVMPKLRHYYVIADGLQGHTERCQKFALDSISKMIKETGDDAAVHAGPAMLPVPQLALQGIERTAATVDLPQGMTSRQKINKRVRAYALENAWSYSDVFAMLFAECANRGIQLKGHVNKGVAEKPLDYAERNGLAGRVYEIAESFLTLDNQKAGNG